MLLFIPLKLSACHSALPRLLPMACWAAKIAAAAQAEEKEEDKKKAKKKANRNWNNIYSSGNDEEPQKLNFCDSPEV